MTIIEDHLRKNFKWDANIFEDINKNYEKYKENCILFQDKFLNSKVKLTISLFASYKYKYIVSVRTSNGIFVVRPFDSMKQAQEFYDESFELIKWNDELIGATEKWYNDSLTERTIPGWWLIETMEEHVEPQDDLKLLADFKELFNFQTQSTINESQKPHRDNLIKSVIYRNYIDVITVNLYLMAFDEVIIVQASWDAVYQREQIKKGFVSIFEANKFYNRLKVHLEGANFKVYTLE